MNSSPDKKLIKEFSKLKARYLDLESTNEMLVQKVVQLSERFKFKDEQRCRLIQICSEKISKKNNFLDTLKRENQHLQEIVNQQNEQILEHEKTIESLKNSTNVKTTVIKHPCFQSDKAKTKKEQKPFQVRYPNLNITVNGRRKITLNESPKLIIGNRQRRKLYSNDDEIVDLSSN